MLIHTTESIQSEFGEDAEAFNVVDMSSAPDEFILAMIHSQMLAITNIGQAVVTPPTIGIDDVIRDATSNNGL